MKQQFLNEGDEGFSAIVASINPLHLQELALTTRRKLGYNDLPETSCVVSTPPRMGSFNIVYEVTFSDGIKWAILGRFACLLQATSSALPFTLLLSRHRHLFLDFRHSIEGF